MKNLSFELKSIPVSSFKQFSMKNIFYENEKDVKEKPGSVVSAE